MDKREYMRIYRETHKEEIRKSNAEWYKNNKDQVRQYQADNRHKIQSRIEQRKDESPEIFLLWWAKYRAKKLNIPFDLSAADIKVPERCPVLGMTLERGKRGNPSSPSLDRFNPERGYVKGNVRVISRRANFLKSDASLEELKKVVEWMEKQ